MIAVDYMQSCSEIGLRMADEILSRVPLDLAGPNSSAQNANGLAEAGMDVEEQTVTRDTVIPAHAIRFCQEHKRTWVMESLIQV